MQEIKIIIKKGGEIYIEGEAIDDLNCMQITEKIIKKIFFNMEKNLKRKEEKEYGKLYNFEGQSNDNE